MQQILTAKIQLIPASKEEEDQLIKLMYAYRKACNLISFYIYDNHELNYSNLHKALYYRIRKQTGLKAQTTQSAVRYVIARYCADATKGHEIRKIVFKSPLVELLYEREYYFTDNNKVHISTLEKPLKLDYFDKGFEDYLKNKKGTASIQYKKNKFFLNIPVFLEIKEMKMSDITNVVGIDRGIRNIAVTYDSAGNTKFYSGKEIQYRRNKYNKIRRTLQKKNTKSSKRRLRKINNREHRWINDVNHCITKDLVDLNPSGTMFVLEDLTNIRKTIKRINKKNRNMISSWSYADIEKKLKYKATLNDQIVCKIDPYCTSLQCPMCGNTSKKNRNHNIHLFTCKNCGFSTNDDRVAAINIYIKGRKLVP